MTVIRRYSNVDGQFRIAGFEEAKVLEIHGSIHHLEQAGRGGEDRPVPGGVRHAPPQCPETGAVWCAGRRIRNRSGRTHAIITDRT